MSFPAPTGNLCQILAGTYPRESRDEDNISEILQLIEICNLTKYIYFFTKYSMHFKVQSHFAKQNQEVSDVRS
ncbi:MAG: hypothetical protein SCARUB_03847 [Candidatus Scalindua rubra]|uniref:Uncharacterized protein n=1 Tax=Candidatus Scalindua rubra TaxID=1872076 RepID=A0A1E3X622_9BACT|nr:MAG: hypothetical protein SCARUB_03847 [Candidatus Scalindua rubra]